MKFGAGDWVEVRSKEEILATLDENGRLEAMPFMPEMLAYCGKRIRVRRRAHKSCDTLNPLSSRSLPDSVLLEGVRCDGSAHGGCEAQCSVFWKTAWLKPAGGETEAAAKTGARGCTEAELHQATQAPNPSGGEIHYRCQATDFPLFSARLHTRSLGQYFEDYFSGNVTLKEIVLTASYFFFKALARPKWLADGGWYRHFYDWCQGLWGGVPYPRRLGRIAEGQPEPSVSLNLQAGDLVRVKPYEEILATLNHSSKNRGLFFDAEMVPYCGGVFRVRKRVDKFLDEKSGAMIRMKTPAVILEGGFCRGRYSAYRAYCPRAIYSWWREAWLERVPEGTEETFASSLGAREILKPRREESLVG